MQEKKINKMIEDKSKGPSGNSQRQKWCKCSRGDSKCKWKLLFKDLEEMAEDQVYWSIKSQICSPTHHPWLQHLVQQTNF